MIRFIDTGAGFVLAYPMWVNLLSALVGLAGLALCWLVVRNKQAQTLKTRLGGLACGIAIAAAGFHFATFKVVITPEFGSVYGFPLRNDTVHWTDASGVTIEARHGKGSGYNYFLIVPRRSGEHFEAPFYGLPEPERQKVAAFVAGRIRH